jgi:hypothetical protein
MHFHSATISSTVSAFVGQMLTQIGPSLLEEHMSHLTNFSPLFFTMLESELKGHAFEHAPHPVQISFTITRAPVEASITIAPSTGQLEAHFASRHCLQVFGTNLPAKKSLITVILERAGLQTPSDCKEQESSQRPHPLQSSSLTPIAFIGPAYLILLLTAKVHQFSIMPKGTFPKHAFNHYPVIFVSQRIFKNFDRMQIVGEGEN